jgi:hypothetical protein
MPIDWSLPPARAVEGRVVFFVDGGFMVLWGLVLIIVVVAVVLWLLIGRRRRDLAEPRDELAIDVASLGIEGPSAAGPRLEVYNVPVRLVVLVLAPVGRSGRIPVKDRLPGVVEQLVPGLMPILNIHRPEFRCWPPQLSWQGFTQAFFAKVRLPGDAGKATPWCGVAGRFEADGRKLLAGMVFCADEPNGLSQIIIERDAQWLDALRIREQST